MKLGILLALVFLAGPVAVVKRSAPGDVTAPNAISNLATSSPTSSTCTLTFSAPYDDAPSSGGAVAAYTCRTCTNGVCGATMDESEFTAATSITNEPTPAAPTTGESFAATISGGLVASTNYTFNCKSTDDASNTSALSNSATCTTAAATFCNGSFTICDSFTSNVDPPGNSDLPGSAGYTECFSGACSGSSTWSTDGDELLAPTSGSGGFTLLHTTTLTDAESDQYAIIQLKTFLADGDTGLLMRSNGASGNAYEVYYASGKIFWADSSFAGVHDSDNASCTVTPSNDDYLVAKIIDTGGQPTVSIWVTTAMPTGPPTGTPTCTITSGTGCTYCDSGTCTTTAPRPATTCTCIKTAQCETGNIALGTRVGPFTNAGSSTKKYDNFAAGIP